MVGALFYEDNIPTALMYSPSEGWRGRARGTNSLRPKAPVKGAWFPAVLLAMKQGSSLLINLFLYD